MIDQVIRSGFKGEMQSLSKHLRDRVEVVAPHAKRFVFSEKASRLIGRFAYQCPDLLLDNWQFALPPYRQTYIEFDSRAFYEDWPESPTSKELIDQTVGYLIDSNKVYCFAGRHTGPNQGVILCPLIWSVVGPGEDPGESNIQILDMEDPKQSDRAVEWLHTGVALGSTFLHLNEEQRAGISSSVRASFGYTIKYWNTLTNNEKIYAVREQAGDVRNVWAFLLWLNQPAKIRYVDVPAAGHLIKGKRVAIPKHHTVEIDLSARTKVMRRHFKSLWPRNSPRRHEVRGAFHHHGGDINCGHYWPLMPDVDGHWKCERCGRLRWWVKDHRRGVSQYGHVEKDYAVVVDSEDMAPTDA